ncbi:unnamed protein product [Chondrus crispus]|uniref:Uncharacterized protein n=1 Tax=Chondrus crispus TaxID=2769 RepID=R7QDV0_CHOCR|nr:unnamed protein product [Chondrus crispus]CDF36264.1 unnamed protein product [Chondrus crispus]|eukprot:XP_005716083.1 unnamed protein product [Chondrus crispus]
MDDVAAFPVWVERTLISVAFTMSASLAILSGCSNWLHKRVRVEYYVVSILALGCIASGVIGWVLFLSEDLSLDAFGVILIGLIPGFEALGKLRVKALKAETLMRKRPALHNTLKDFSFLRHGNPPTPEVQEKLNIDPLTRTYLRIPACSKPKALKPKTEMWFGEIVQHDDKMITLKGKDDLGDAISWWKAANRGVDLVRCPSRARFTETIQVTRALELVAEIAMIGDSVLLNHEKALKKHVETSGNIRDALHATPASICTTFLRAIGLLEEWGPVDDAARDRYIQTEFKDFGRGKKYGMLFFILLVESHIFQASLDKRGRCFGFCKPEIEHTRASDVIEAFKASSQESNERKGITTKWLRQYFTDDERFSKFAETEDGEDNGIATNNSNSSGPAGGVAVAAVQSDGGAGNVVISFRLNGSVLRQASDFTVRIDDVKCAK